MERNQIYKCTESGTIIEVLTAGETCEGHDMRPLVERTEDAGNEKHVPIVEKTANGILVKIGEVPHPMEEDHWIEWIEVIAKDASYRKYLNPGDAPEAEFPPIDGEFYVREHCNLHGLWRTK